MSQHTLEVQRAYRVALDPTPAQLEDLKRHAGAARWAFNHALAAKVAAHRLWLQEVAAATYEQGLSEEQARRQVKVPLPRKAAIQRAWNAGKGDSRKSVDGCCPWWWEVGTYAFQSAFTDCDRAWENWLASLAGRRKGRRVGYPRFKKRGRAIDSFRLHHDVTRPTIRPDGYRRLQLPRIGSVRLHGNLRALARRIARGTAVIASVTISRHGHRWWASILARETIPVPARPTPRQQDAGTVGVDLGVTALAALSTGEIITNPRHLRAATGRLERAQRALSRTQRGSNRRAKAAAKVGRLHAMLTERRAGHLHQLTKRLTTGWAVIAIEDLNVAGMTRRPAPRPIDGQPGAWAPNGARAKAGLNKAILDVSPGELRRQLTYKSSWYGSTVKVIDRYYPSSQLCSTCGRRNPSLTLADRVYTCECGANIDRDVNAAINLAQAVGAHSAPPVAPDTEETLNARRGLACHPTRPAPDQAESTTREGPPPSGSPPRSNPGALLNT